ncbi:MAG: methylated-DNA--[protein]-cysteine S-methyltransferase [Actinobacteria bacterium]|jgi:AraC family transcriptional regulator of adaptative response/methylated-DNA-[protein]-cysteine methyltransferase|nr:methylated-DNA--[protein]-cysteine S-methyltransferase [Actinomycetota bacterium]
MSTPRQRVAAACEQMTTEGGPVAVTRLAADLHCSSRQLQRDFADVLGITPRQFGQAVRTDRTRTALRAADSVLEAAFAAGYGSVRGFYEEAARRLGMTPTDYVAGAPSHVLLWSIAETSVGDVVAVATPRGLAAVRIGRAADLEGEIREEFPLATLVRDDAAMADVMSALRALCSGDRAPELPVDAHGTAFQARVWSALREIPSGETRTYAEVAASIGRPTAVRAVARACATNPVALAIPCHRVLRSDGSLAGYRWGITVKESLLVHERA